MANAWMNHVKSVKRQHPKKMLPDLLKIASKSYKKTGKKMKHRGGKKTKKRVKSRHRRK